jgi:hypothetical protein
MHQRLTGHKYCGNVGSLPALGKVITFASFQDSGKCDSQVQWLNKWVRCTNGLVRLLMHSFGTPSFP